MSTRLPPHKSLWPPWMPSCASEEVRIRWSLSPAAPCSGWARCLWGSSLRGIAAEMHLAEATVKRHLANIYQKVRVRSRSEATRVALQEQWIGILEITEAAPSADGSSPDGTSDG